MTIDIEVDFSSLKKIFWAIQKEEASGQLKRQLERDLRAAVKPAAEESKASLLSMHSAGLTVGESLRKDVVGRLKTQARTQGAGAGVRVKVGWGGPRGFYTAARRLNRPAGWRHPVFGDREVWVHQTGKPEWFETPLRAHREQYRAAIRKAMEDMAERIARGV